MKKRSWSKLEANFFLQKSQNDRKVFKIPLPVTTYKIHQFQWQHCPWNKS